MDETFRLPPCIRIIWRETLSPIPEPSSLVVKNGTNISFMISGEYRAVVPYRINTFPVGPCSAERGYVGIFSTPQSVKTHFSSSSKGLVP